MLIQKKRQQTARTTLHKKMHLLTANKTGCLEDFLFLLLLTPQVSERIDDDPKDQVEDDDDDHEEEEQVVDNSGCKQGLLPKSRKAA